MSGCANREPVQFAPINSGHSENSSANKIEVYITNAPKKQYQEIGVLTFKEWSPYPDESQAIKLLRQKASIIGADAILILESRSGSAANSYNGISYAYTDFRAMAIKFYE